MTDHLLFVTHSEVVIDPDQPIPDWPLSEVGRARMVQFAEVLATGDMPEVFHYNTGSLLQALKPTHDLTPLDDLPGAAQFDPAFVASPIVAAALSARIGRSVGRASAWACAATTAACAIVAFSPIIALDGARGVGPILTVMCIHGWLAVRMGPRPIGVPRESA